MDLRTLTYLLSVMVSALSNTVASAPASEVAAAASRARHVRNKRCSCATFLDKECVYFCHLDIIWVNTPERVVSYGLGNAPRRRRSAGDSSPQGPRCRCLRGHDGACDDFCRPDNQLRYNKTLPSKAVLRAEGTLAAAAARINRRKNGESIEETAVMLRTAATKARVVLETWRTRRWRRRTEEKEAPVAS